MEKGQSSKYGEKIVQKLMQMFEIQKSDLVNVGYIDLIETISQ
jgi:hypothetical protein